MTAFKSLDDLLSAEFDHAEESVTVEDDAPPWSREPHILEWWRDLSPSDIGLWRHRLFPAAIDFSRGIVPPRLLSAVLAHPGEPVHSLRLALSHPWDCHHSLASTWMALAALDGSRYATQRMAQMLLDEARASETLDGPETARAYTARAFMWMRRIGNSDQPEWSRAMSMATEIVEALKGAEKSRRGGGRIVGRKITGGFA